MTELFDPLRNLLLDVCSPVKSTEHVTFLKQKLGETAPERILKLAAIEFLSPLLYYHLKQLNIPGYNGIVPGLKESYMKNTARNVLLLKQVKLLKRQAEQDGIRILLLKGAGLSISVYHEIGLRSMADIDILIEQQHTGRIRELMEQNNMHPLFKDTNQNWLFNIKSHIVPYQSFDNTLSLEVHTRLFDDRFIHFADIDPFEKAFSVNWDNESFLLPDLSVTFIYGLYHSVIHHNFSFRLRDIVDLRYMASSYNLMPEQIAAFLGPTHAAGIFLPLIDSVFEPSDVNRKTRLPHAYLYWTNSVVMKYLPIQLTSRLSDATLRIATVFTSGVKIWLSRIFNFTDYEVSVFFKSRKPGGIFKRTGMALWLISIAIVYAIVLPLFYIKIKVQNIIQMK